LVVGRWPRAKSHPMDNRRRKGREANDQGRTTNDGFRINDGFRFSKEHHG
jgi:hypothetical protein